MTKAEFSKISMAIKTYYPKETLLPNQQAMDLWFFQLQDIPFDVAELAVNKWVATNRWSPSISDLREMAQSIMQGNTPDWGEAWLEVNNAIARFGHYREREALESMSPLARQTAERLGFQNLCLSDNPVADRAKFENIFNQLAERQSKENRLPDNLRLLISQVNTKMIEGGSA